VSSEGKEGSDRTAVFDAEQIRGRWIDWCVRFCGKRSVSGELSVRLRSDAARDTFFHRQILGKR
jgi:hypothetical protein